MKKVFVFLFLILLSLCLCLPVNVIYINGDNNSHFVREESRSIESGGGLEGYYNIGSTLTVVPEYSLYNMNTELEQCDIIYEVSETSSIIHHICVVESIEYDTNSAMYYVRVIEAIDDGVCYGLFDEYRMNEKNAVIYRVNGLTANQKNNILYFLYGQIGKSYFLNLFGRSYDYNSDNWYCSELCWAAYFYAGINLDGNTTGFMAPVNIVSNVSYSTVTMSSHIHQYGACSYVSSLIHTQYCPYCGGHKDSPHIFFPRQGYQICNPCGYIVYNN